MLNSIKSRAKKLLRIPKKLLRIPKKEIWQDALLSIPRKHINQFGVDPFGFDPRQMKNIAPFMAWMYKNYFRVETQGINNLPDGKFLLISNHSGQLPFDAAMIATACLIDNPKPRILRGMVERWSAEIPFISHLFVRMGQVVGDPNTCIRLLKNDEAVMVFPEGARGINKMYAERYQLTEFGHGFMRLALESKAPIIPVAVVGAEEQAPAVFDIKVLAKMFGLPALPIIFPQIIPFPMPVKYHIHFGEAMHFDDGDHDNDILVAAHVQKVKDTIQDMLHKGLESREGIF